MKRNPTKIKELEFSKNRVNPIDDYTLLQGKQNEIFVKNILEKFDGINIILNEDNKTQYEYTEGGILFPFIKERDIYHSMEIKLDLVSKKTGRFSIEVSRYYWSNVDNKNILVNSGIFKINNNGTYPKYYIESDGDSRIYVFETKTLQKISELFDKDEYKTNGFRLSERNYKGSCLFKFYLNYLQCEELSIMYFYKEDSNWFQYINNINISGNKYIDYFIKNILDERLQLMSELDEISKKIYGE